MLTESVTAGKLPNTGNELASTSVSNSETNDEFRVCDTASRNVEHAQDPSRGGETEKTERRRVGKLAVVDGETGLRGVLCVAAS